MLGHEVDALARDAQVLEEILAHETHEVVHGLARAVLAPVREASQQGDVHGRVELGDRLTRHAKPLGRALGSARVEVLGRLEPAAEAQGVLVQPEVIEDQAERTGRRVFAREVVMVEAMRADRARRQCPR